MPSVPFPQSYWFHERLLVAGHYPGHQEPADRDIKLTRLLDHGVCRVLSLMESGETGHNGEPFAPYLPRLNELAKARGVTVTRDNIPVRDQSAPTVDAANRIVAWLNRAIADSTPAYVHCWGGHGRTSTAVACFLIARGATLDEAVAAIMQWRATTPKRHDPFSPVQLQFLRSWTPPRRPNPV
ncbi:MAG: hypothetical protein K1X57_14905 [Gemmataceae bacterium]|nr:hypothetical protein [Gemmataceae bacterium]